MSVRGEVVVLDQTTALEAEARVKEALREGKAALWHLCEAAYDFDRARGWEALGYGTLTDWLRDPEIDTTRGTFYRWVGTWKKLVIESGVTPKQLEGVPMSKADLVADAVAEGKVKPAKATQDATELSASKLREKYEKPRRGRPPKGPEKKKAPSPTIHPNDALAAAHELPWEWIEEITSGTTPIDLRKARFKQALGELLAWRAAYGV